MRRRIWIPLVLLLIVVRWALLVHPGYVADTNAYKRWALRAAQHGIGGIYETSDMDYPPLYAWILYPLGKAAQAIDPEGAEAMRDGQHLTVLVKLPPLLFDLALAWLLALLGRRVEASRSRKGPPWRWILPGAYLFNPAVVFDTGYWGQPDCIHSFFVLAAFLSIATRGTGGSQTAWRAWVLLALATLMKPLGAPFFPLLLALSLWWHGRRATAIGIGAALAATVVVFLPFILTGRTGSVFQRVVGDVDLMAYTSVNAHNLWWALGAWKPADQPWLGPFTLTHLGLALFLGVYAAILHRVLRAGREPNRREPEPRVSLLLALGVAFSFFMLSTHMHENHLFLALPFAIALLPFEAGRGRGFAWLAGLLTVGVLINLATHDPWLAQRAPLNLGGSTGVLNPHFRRPYAGVELTLIWIGTLLNLAVYAVFLFRLLRQDRLFSALPGSPPSAPRSGPPGRRGSC